MNNNNQETKKSLEFFEFETPELECSTELQRDYFASNIETFQREFNKAFGESQLAERVVALPCDLDDGTMDTIECTVPTQPKSKVSLVIAAQHLAAKALAELLCKIPKPDTDEEKGMLALHPRLKVKVSDREKWSNMLDVTVTMQYIFSGKIEHGHEIY